MAKYTRTTTRYVRVGGRSIPVTTRTTTTRGGSKSSVSIKSTIRYRYL